MKQIIPRKKLMPVALVFISSIVMYSCKTTIYVPYAEYSGSLSGKADTLVNRNHFIDSADAWDWITRYRTYKNSISNNTLVVGGITYTNILTDETESFNKELFEKILTLKDCIGVHIYYGLDEHYEEHLLLSGIGPNYETLYITGNYSGKNGKGAAPALGSGGGMGEYGLKP